MGKDLPKVETGAGADLRPKAQVHHLPSPWTSFLCPVGLTLTLILTFFSVLFSLLLVTHTSGFFDLTAVAVLLTLMPRG